MDGGIHHHEHSMLRRGASRIGVALCTAVLALGATASVSQAKRSFPPGVAAAINTPGFPGFVGVGYGSVWVAGHRNGKVYRVDPRTNKVIATLDVPAATCGVFERGAGSMWAMGCPEAGLEASYRIDPKTNRVAHSYSGITPVIGAGSLWLTSWTRRVVMRVDLATGRVIRQIRKLNIDTTKPFILGGVRFGSVWVYSDAAVARISTSTNKVTAVIALPGAKASGAGLDGGSTAFAEGAVWVANPAGLFRIDPKSNRARLLGARVKPFSDYTLMTVSSGRRSLWMRDSDRTIARISPAGKLVTRYPAAGGGGGIAFGFGSLWVANFTANSVWRLRIAA
jgi:streptogramin lyase